MRSFGQEIADGDAPVGQNRLRSVALLRDRIDVRVHWSLKALMIEKIRRLASEAFSNIEFYLVLMMALVGISYAIYSSIEKHDTSVAYRAMRAELSRCSSDCSGHRAGYAWAKAHNVMAVDDCNGQSLAFLNGCMSYVYDQMEQDGQSDHPDQAPY